MRRKGIETKIRFYKSADKGPIVSDKNLQLQFKSTNENIQILKKIYKRYIDKQD